jgi:hypothetical protein
MCAASRVHDTIRSSTRRFCAQSWGRRGSATCTCEKLGGLRHARRDSSNMGWRNRSLRGFADHMQTSEFDAGLQRLIKLAGQKRSALMCAGAVPWRCHRSLIADALTVLGIRVEDIMSKNRSQVHSLTSFGRVRRSRITYPFSKRSLLSSHVRSKRSGKRTER